MRISLTERRVLRAVARLKIRIILGLVMTVEALPLLYYGLHHLNLVADNKALSTFSFEIILFFGLFSIFVVREKRHFWSSWPSKTLLFLILGDMILGFLLTTFGLLSLKAIPMNQTLMVFGYVGVFSLLINDFIKYILIKKWHM
jgi:H+-transporting ATPase